MNTSQSMLLTLCTNHRSQKRLFEALVTGHDVSGTGFEKGGTTASNVDHHMMHTPAHGIFSAFTACKVSTHC